MGGGGEKRKKAEIETIILNSRRRQEGCEQNRTWKRVSGSEKCHIVYSIGLMVTRLFSSSALYSASELLTASYFTTLKKERGL